MMAPGARGAVDHVNETEIKGRRASKRNKAGDYGIVPECVYPFQLANVRLCVKTFLRFPAP